ncbi:hypothetical protein EPUS_07341 [Endocarpon pusillum Z07020]|uniref:Uncharacterized protein n=1 Tax=Endocarpon pusillum (strain Z07020 / HMAS-L-300199) TaxID=1263415 RepID=U1HJQ5_ENDPU|nr:uncharacterized protein EPUS_07341 [Endocarpon pusillum Z07020]ERF70485.1 hypothetical protein EPUS_07341 [Endocarpon pusillum Z07020]
MPINIHSSNSVLMEGSEVTHQQHHGERVYKCTIIYSEYDCWKQPRKPVRQGSGVWLILKDIALGLVVCSGIMFLSLVTWFFPMRDFITKNLFDPETRSIFWAWVKIDVWCLVVTLWLGKVMFNYWDVVMLVGIIIFSKSIVAGKAILSTVVFVLRLPVIPMKWLMKAILNLWRRLSNRPKASTSQPIGGSSLAPYREGTVFLVFRAVDPSNNADSLYSVWEMSDEDEELM